MMLCPTDQVKLKCLETRTFDDGTVRRRYSCPTCSNKFASVEELASDPAVIYNHYETREQYKARILEESSEMLSKKFGPLLADSVVREEAIETVRRGADSLKFFGIEQESVKNLEKLADLLENM